MKKILSLLLLACSLQAYDYQVAICSVFRNEAPYLKEWIEFHQLIGVEHFYLYNNRSDDDYATVLAPYIEDGVVELFDWDVEAENRNHWKKVQVRALFDGAKKALSHAKWLAFIDADEFIFPVADQTLLPFLEKYEDYGAVALHWLLFGTSHIENLDPNQLMIEQLLYRAPAKSYVNIFFKSIVKTECLNFQALAKGAHDSSHSFPLKSPFSTVNVDYQRVGGDKSSNIPDPEKAVIHHYALRDEQFFHMTKLARPNITHGKKEALMRWSKEANKVKDIRILHYAEELYEKINKRIDA